MLFLGGEHEAAGGTLCPRYLQSNFPLKQVEGLSGNVFHRLGWGGVKCSFLKLGTWVSFLVQATRERL